MNYLIQDPTFWVATSFVVFILLIIKPLKKSLSSNLNDKINEFKRSIDEAKKLKSEAEVLYKEQLKIRDENSDKIKRMKQEIIRETKLIKANFEKDIDNSQLRKQKNYDQISSQLKAKLSMEFKKEILGNAIIYAEYRIKKNLSHKHNEVLIEESLKKLSSHKFN